MQTSKTKNIYLNTMNAMIFAAGLGTRLQPLTLDRPKALVEVAGKTLLEHTILKLRQSGFDHIVVNIHHFGDQIISFLDAHQHFGIDIKVSDERGCLLDTGGGLRKALPLFADDAPVLIHNVDIVSQVDLRGMYESHKGDATLIINRRDTSRYLLFDESYRLRGWTNIKTGEVKGEKASVMRAFSGIHVVSTGLLKELDSFVDSTYHTPFATQEIPFPIMDFYIGRCGTLDFRGIELPDNTPWVDCGKIESLEEAAKILL